MTITQNSNISPLNQTRLRNISEFIGFLFVYKYFLSLCVSHPSHNDSKCDLVSTKIKHQADKICAFYK